MTSDKLSIGFLTSALSSLGGMDRYSKFMVDSFARNPDVSSVVVVAQTNSINESVDAEVYKEITTGSYGFRTQWSVFRACMRRFKKCDVILCTMEKLGPGAALASLFLRSPLFIVAVGSYSVPPKGYTPRSFIKRQMMRFMYWRSAQILTMSENNVKLINEVITVTHWTFAPNGVDISYFPMRDIGKVPEENFLMTVGDVKPRKGADTTIQALNILKDRFPDLKYKIIGDTNSFPNFVERLRTLIREYGLEGRVEILGRIDDDELKGLLQRCVAFVLAARNDNGSIEGFPMAFYEAHACGAPVVSTYGFGSEYVIKDGYNGFLVQPNDPAELAEAIGKIVGDRALYESMVQNARKEAEKHTWDKTAERYYIETFKRFI